MRGGGESPSSWLPSCYLVILDQQAILKKEAALQSRKGGGARVAGDYGAATSTLKGSFLFFYERVYQNGWILVTGSQM